MIESNTKNTKHVDRPGVDEAHETRERLLDSAEELFARQGFDGTTIRDLITLAGCKNIAAVNYYFGDKKELYDELFRVRLRETRESRLEAIEAAMEKRNKPTLEKLLGAYAEDFLKPFNDPKRSQRFMQLFFRELAERRLPKNMFLNEMARPTIEALEDAISAVCPKIGKRDILMSILSITGQLVHIMQVRVLFEGTRGHSIASIDINEAVEHIVKFSAAGMRALGKGS
jgi:AcrR family transcriptional regulator